MLKLFALNQALPFRPWENVSQGTVIPIFSSPHRLPMSTAIAASPTPRPPSAETSSQTSLDLGPLVPLPCDSGTLAADDITKSHTLMASSTVPASAPREIRRVYPIEDVGYTSLSNKKLASSRVAQVMSCSC